MAEAQRPRRRLWVGSVMVVVLAVVAGCTNEASPPEPDPNPEPTPTTEPATIEAAPLPAAILIPAPSVLGTPLSELDQASRAAAPTRWAAGPEPVPFGQWWSGLLTEPGIPALWAQPLLLRSDDNGRADLSVPTYTTRADGFRDAVSEPAVFFEFGPDAAIRVVDTGPLHVRFTVFTNDVNATITMVQGSPFLEFEGTGTLSMTVPGLADITADTTAATVDRFSTAVGPWLLASSGASVRRINGDQLEIDLVPDTRHAIGPVVDNADERYDAAALSIAMAPLDGTEERLTVAEDGTVRQVLRQQRAGTDAVAWSLLPHHGDHIVGGDTRIGSLESAHGQSDIVATNELTLEYPAVPILWDAVASPGFEPASFSTADVPPIVASSYFGARTTATTITVHDVLQAGGATAESAPYLQAAIDSLQALMSPSSEPLLNWDPAWGSVVVFPAEFGSGTELNDHHLQNGSWVGTAASVVVADPSQRSAIEQGIDLLIADYAGAAAVPSLTGTVSNEGTWSAFHGHSWASGLGGFGSGNNLESISESSFAWWAAAKWFLATNRPELADTFIARLTIESWLTGGEWLPTEENQSDDPTIRPWSGVVWAGKSDPGTWFDASDEAALGIRLLPIGPQSFSRYHSRDTIEAARTRWAWCDDRGDGCVERWWNLLDTDAAVAGRTSLTPGELPNTSTADIVRQWWRAHWEDSAFADGWVCPPGAIMRRTADGSLVALASNPTSAPVTVTCRDRTGTAFETEVEARSSAAVVIE